MASVSEWALRCSHHALGNCLRVEIVSTATEMTLWAVAEVPVVHVVRLTRRSSPEPRFALFSQSWLDLNISLIYTSCIGHIIFKQRIKRIDSELRNCDS